MFKKKSAQKQKRYTFDDKTITFDYIVRKNPRAQSVRITVLQEKCVIVTLPRWIPYVQAPSLVYRHREWIWKHVQDRSKTLHSPLGKESHYKEYKEKARKHLIKRLEELNQEFYGFTYGQVRIKNTHTRWGSCSKKGNINLSYRLLFLPQELQDYVLIHELCHLKEMNHGPKFWELVKIGMSEYKSLRAKLKDIH